ncbi:MULTISPECIES: LysM-like peptidoglycan-binding domain-containing protein [Glaesserella]|uniref:Opacity-associated protein A LysM-like domain-containing protein n=1 Tax=Glaesserella australis TaxID=2094024 RepID=A0A328C2U0_9PAST|nr:MULTISPECIES: LysM-like peptidoglycan-binding domain-containing protein [Glaesserella]AUI66640.1 hypothetical protein CJD39_08670 [Glaesserella sp. 15-184]RAL18814.1 hypothetical protein C5N92_06695 [Glaesserella australis]
MSQQNMRKEPTFGQPSTTQNNVEAENIEHQETVNKEKVNAQKLAFSLHSSKSPGHTFTPVMKRPVETSQNLSSMEEQAEQKAQAVEQPKPVAPQVTKNAGFAFAPVAEEKVAQETAKEAVQAETKSAIETQKPTTVVPPSMNTNNIERVIPTQTQPETKTSAMNKVPSKYRRLILVGLLALALLLVFFLLKPSTPETVEQLQEQGNSLPIEFRPVDEAEAKRAEEEAKAMQEAQAAANSQQAETTATQQSTTPATETTAPTAPVATDSVTTQQPVAQTTETTPAVAVKPAMPAVTEPVKPVVNKPVVIEEAKKPASTGSVIYQAETEKAPAVEKKVEKLKPAPQPKAEVKTEKVTTQVAEKTKAVATTQKTATPVANGIVATKTLTVPKGISLMQVFRDNNLNISDVNAMSKVNSAVSNLKVGEKVTVRLDKNNRVAEMSIGAGKYIRQADGSYIFR